MSAVTPVDHEVNLDAIAEERSALDAQLPALVAARTAANGAYRATGFDLKSDEFSAAKEAGAAAESVESRIAELDRDERRVLNKMQRDATKVGDREQARAWDIESMVASEEVRGQLRTMSASKQKFGGLNLGFAATREQMVADITGTTSMRRADYIGVVPQIRRRLKLLDLIPTGQMDQNTLPYTVESGSLDGALETPEGNAKPEGALTLTDATADAQTIAVWQKLRKQALADFPALSSIVSSRIRYMVLRRLEREILIGDGTGSNIRGILNTPGILTQAFVTGKTKVDMVRRGITDLQLADVDPGVVVLHPSDFEDIETLKTTTNAYVTGDRTSMDGTDSWRWGLDVVTSPLITQGTALIGDFQIGTQLFIREGVEVLLSDNDANDFTTNRVTLLAEMRAALPVFRPTAFVSVALA